MHLLDDQNTAYEIIDHGLWTAGKKLELSKAYIYLMRCIEIHLNLMVINNFSAVNEAVSALNGRVLMCTGRST